jgi:hypothetical protein
MFHVGFLTMGVAFLSISFLMFAFPDRYVRLANFYFAKTKAERRLQLKTYQRWPYRISGLLLFLGVLLGFYQYIAILIHH